MYSGSKNQMAPSSRVAGCRVQTPLVLWLPVVSVTRVCLLLREAGPQHLVPLAPCAQTGGLSTKGFHLGPVVVLRMSSAPVILHKIVCTFEFF